MLKEFWFNHSIIVLPLFVALVIIVSAFFYKRSVKSRKYFMCPNCKEVYRTEHMTSTTCKICGSEVVEVKNKDVTDKTF